MSLTKMHSTKITEKTWKTQHIKNSGKISQENVPRTVLNDRQGQTVKSNGWHN